MLPVILYIHGAGWVFVPITGGEGTITSDTERSFRAAAHGGRCVAQQAEGWGGFRLGG